MSLRDPRVDAYITKCADFARPILTRLRALVHEACPDAEETLKWSRPVFMWRGLLRGMAAFKQHCTFHFWKHSLILKEGGRETGEVMDQLGRIARVTELPSAAAIKRTVRQAMRFNEEGVRAPKRIPRPTKPLAVPAELTHALRRNRKAREAFAGFSPSHRREYVEWITEAKQEATRQRRLETTMAWLAEGKPRNRKYMGKS